MSQYKAKAKGHSQAHQNKEKWHHNPNSVLTKKILSIEHYCLCYRCEAQIEWRKTYRKYKLLKGMRRCNGCLQHAISRSYHTFCDACATERSICAKCGKSYDISNKVKPVTDEEMMDILKKSDIKERYKRTILRNWERGLFVNHDIIKIIDILLTGETVKWEDWVVEDDCCDDDEHDHNHSAPAKQSKGAIAYAEKLKAKLDLSELLPEDSDSTTTTTTTTTTTSTTPTTEPSTTTPSTTTTPIESTPKTTEPVAKKKITILPKQTVSRVGAMSAAIPQPKKK